MSEQPLPRLRLADRTLVIPECPLDETVPDDHPVRLVVEYLSQLDLSAFFQRIRAVEGLPGRNATDPAVLLALWMWATIDGVGSARELDRLCSVHAVYRWIAGGLRLNYHTLSSFRQLHAVELEALFVAHVAALIAQGLVQLNCVAQDGMRVRASAGASSFRLSATIEEAQKEVEEQLAELKRQPEEPANAVSKRQEAARQRQRQERRQRLAEARRVAVELEEKRRQRDKEHPAEAAKRQQQDQAEQSPRASTTDAESRRMKMPDGGYRPGYNVQCGTDVTTGIIAGIDVTNQGTDGGLMLPMMEQLQENYGITPKQALVDGGYGNKQDVEEAKAKGIEVFTPLKNEKKDLQEGKDPYQAKKRDGPGMKDLRERMGTVEAKETYKKRASTAEWVNAGMRNRGLYQVKVRGLQKVRTVVLLYALAHNLVQMIQRCASKKPGWKWQEILRAEGKQQAK